MNTFYIPEANLERLEKRLQTIQKKCKANQYDFHYQIIGEEFHTINEDTPDEATIKYIVIEAEGTVKHEGWEFVATLDHSNAAGNIIRAYNTELKIPDRYKTCDPTCEHCNKIRSRKDTYIIYNQETKEFKQVGRACLAEYTNGLSAEHVADLESFFKVLEDSSWSTPLASSYNKYQQVEEVLRYAFECYRHFGYQKAYYDEYETRYTRSTRDRVSDYMQYDSGKMNKEWREVIQAEMEEVGFDANSKQAIQMTQDSLKWIAEQDVENNDYLRNLQIICSEKYTENRNFGILVSLPAAYGRYLDHKAYEEKKQEQQKIELKSEYQGEKGDKLEIATSSVKCISTFDSMYGTTWLYKIVDTDGNIYVWYASKPIDNPEIVKKIRGTVKDHSEYNEVKQTVLTRCKVIEVSNEAL